MRRQSSALLGFGCGICLPGLRPRAVSFFRDGGARTGNVAIDGSRGCGAGPCTTAAQHFELKVSVPTLKFSERRSTHDHVMQGPRATHSRLPRDKVRVHTLIVALLNRLCPVRQRACATPCQHAGRFVSSVATFLFPPLQAKPPRTQAAARTLKNGTAGLKLSARKPPRSGAPEPAISAMVRLAACKRPALLAAPRRRWKS